MVRLSDDIISFFQKQHFVVVSTICRRSGRPHNSCKGIVKVNKAGRIYLLDVYKWQTYGNLKQDPKISITAVDEHRFKGWCLGGKAKIVPGSRLRPDIIKAWEAKVAGRISHRLLKNMKEERGHQRHPESQLPRPEYMIVVEVEEIIDLTPHHMREKEK